MRHLTRSLGVVLALVAATLSSGDARRALPRCGGAIVISALGNDIDVQTDLIKCVAGGEAIWSVLNLDDVERRVSVSDFVRRRAGGGTENTRRKLFVRPPPPISVRAGAVRPIRAIFRNRAEWKPAAICDRETPDPCFDTRFKYTARLLDRPQAEEDPDVEVSDPGGLVPDPKAPPNTPKTPPKKPPVK